MSSESPPTLETADSEELDWVTSAAQGSAGDEPMNLTENIKRIEYLADRTFIKVQAGKLEDARDKLIHISVHNNEALQQLDELIKQQHIDDVSEV